MIAAIIIITGILNADVPRIINYQGRLTDSGGNLIADGNYLVKFTIWSHETSSDPGSEEWTSDFRTITISDGLFTYNLGDTVSIPDNIFAENPMLWLGIKVGGDPEYSPRARIVASPYAFHALRADSASIGGGWRDYGSTVRLVENSDYVLVGANIPVMYAKFEVQTTEGIGILGFDTYSESYGYLGSPESGVHGYSQNHDGVYGSSENGDGVFGTSGFSYGVSGKSGSTYGVYGQGVKGVYGYHEASQHYGYLGGEFYGVVGRDSASGIWGGLGSAASGVYGHAFGTDNHGVWGCHDDDGSGVFGVSPWGNGVLGSSAGGYGVHGTSASSYGVYGEGNKGVYGSHSSGNYGYLGGNNEGVYGNSSNDKGVNGFSEFNIGVYGETVSGFGVYGTCDYEENGYAGYFTGRTYISGNLGIGDNTPDAKLQVDGAIRLGDGEREFEIEEELQSDGDLWDTLIDYGGISIGSETGNNRQRFIFSDGAGAQNIFTIATSTNNGVSYANRFEVQQDGKVGIGTSSPGANLHVVGDICYTGSIGACSDARYKTDIETIDDALETLLNLRGIKYNWKQKEYSVMNFDNKTHLGLIAQEVKEVLPEIVIVDENGDMSVDYSRLTPLLLEAIREQQKTINDLETQMAQIQSLLQQLLDEKQP